MQFNYIQCTRAGTSKIIFILFILMLSSCEDSLDERSYSDYSESNFYKSPEDAKLAVTALYSKLNRDGYSIFGAGIAGFKTLSSVTTDEMTCSWGSQWTDLHNLNFYEDFPDTALSLYYTVLMPEITNTTVTIDKINSMDNLGDDLKARYIGEAKTLRALMSYILYDLYGPVPIRLDTEKASDPDADPIPRPSKEEMVKQIESDYKEAYEALPTATEQKDENYGRMTKEISLMGRLKLYMHEKQWDDAIDMARKLMDMGHILQAKYGDIFTYENNGNSQEVLFAIPTRKDANSSNLWLAHALPGNYEDPNGQPLTKWGGYSMPWDTYDKFDPKDERTERLLAKWPTDGGEMYDGRAEGYPGAIMMKYGMDPNATGENHGVNIVIWRYADVLLSLAEAINETSGGPTGEAYELVEKVRNRAGLDGLPAGLSQDEFREKLMDERLFEFWAEGGIRREDLIRWGKYVERAKNDGSTAAKEEYTLLPIPRKAISESDGIIKQNPGY